MERKKEMTVRKNGENVFSVKKQEWWQQTDVAEICSRSSNWVVKAQREEH